MRHPEQVDFECLKCVASMGMRPARRVGIDADGRTEDNGMMTISTERTDDMDNPSMFPMGAPNDAYAQYFEGQSYRAPLAGDGQVNVANVTFEPGCTNHWHIHHGACQILLGVGGRGYYQIDGQDPVELKPGDVAYIPPETKHWHGAAPTEAFAHVAVMPIVEGASNEWLEPVDDDMYRALK